MKEITGMPAGVSFMHGGFSGSVETLVAALKERHVDFLAADAGSTDAGPFFLGSGKGMTHREGIKQSFAALLPICLKNNVPAIIGSCGMGGTRNHLDSFREIVEEVVAELGLHLKLGLIDSEQDKGYVKAKLREGKIRPLAPAAELTEDAIERSSHIVGMQGTEPIIEALRQGADLVLCGRVSDSALFAAVPVMNDIPLAQAWHMAKVIDHGYTNVEPTEGVVTSVYGVAGPDSFRVEATNPNGRINPMRVAHATVYENNTPYHLYEPPGMLDITGAKFDQLNPRSVVVTGSKFVPKPYTIKLEGAECVGYRTITIAGTRDPDLIGQLDSFLHTCKERVRSQAAAQGIAPETYKFFFRMYGKNAVMQEWEPSQDAGHEVAVVAEAIGPTQEVANALMNMGHVALLHYNYPGRLHTTGNMAFPYSPSDIECGPTYQFNVWHILQLDNPLEACQVRVVSL